MAQQPTRPTGGAAPATPLRASHPLDAATERGPAPSALPEKATHQQTRAFNQQLVLRAIYRHDATSRAEVARSTGLTRTSVSHIVGELLRAGLVEEIGRGPSSGGKAPILLSVAPAARFVMGLDLGENVFRGAIVDLRGEIVRSAALPLEGRNGDEAVARVMELIEALRRPGDQPLLGIGIAAPGLIDSRSGTVRWAVNLDWTDLRLGPRVADRYGVPVIVANDSQAAALAELAFHRRLHPANLIVIRVGRGIGAGVILDGELYQGDGFGAGEIGHTALVADGVRCHCGSVGCLETVASMQAMVEAAGRQDPGLADERAFVAAFHSGDATARRVVAAASRVLGIGIAALIGALNIRHIVLVGPAAALGPDWVASIREAAKSSALPLLARETVIEIGRAQENAVLLGASALLMTEQLGLSPTRR